MTTDRPTVSFDHYDKGFASDPVSVLESLRRRCPVAYSEAHDGFWIVSSHDQAAAVLHDPHRFSSRYVSIPKTHPTGELLPPVNIDPPDHARVKHLLSGAFVPKRMLPLEQRLRERAADLLDSLAQRRTFDASLEFARVIPTYGICQLFGIADEDAKVFTSFVDAFEQNKVNNPPAAGEAARSLLEFVRGLVEQRKVERGDDVISYFLDVEAHGERLTESEVTLASWTLIFAGVETTWSVLGSALLYLAENPAQQALLRREPARIQSAREEFLRAYAPVMVARIVSEDAVVGDQQLKAGDMVLISTLAMNRDPSSCTDPEVIDLEREPNRHASFGLGIHRCLGVNLARMEISIGIEEVLRRLPPFSCSPDHEVTWSTGPVRRVTQLYIELHPTGQEASAG